MRATSLVKQMLTLRSVTVIEVLVRPHELLIKLKAYPIAVGMPEMLLYDPVLLWHENARLALETPRHRDSPDVALVPTKTTPVSNSRGNHLRQYHLPDQLGSLGLRGTSSTW